MPSTSTARPAERPRSLRVLSLDGGGVKGYSTLLILKRIFERMAVNGAMPRPCDIFDLIVGTSTGGLIAIMLGRLHMTIEECLKEYEKTSARVFGSPIAQNKLGKIFKKVSSGSFYDVETLEAAICDLLKDQGLSREEAFWEASPECKVMVCVTRSITSKADVIRNYTSTHPTQENYKCAIWEAAAATAAAPMFFRSVKLASSGEEWVDGAMRRNNPINEALNEVNRESEAAWAGRSIGCVLSIGTGVSEVRKVSNSASALIKSVVKIMTDSEDTADSFLNSSFGQQLERSQRYFRFNVPQGMQALKLDEWEETEKMKAFTIEYLSKYDTGKSVKACVQSLLDPDATIPVTSRKLTLRDSPCASFVDRSDYIDALKAFFWTYVSDKSQVYILWGLGGVGKTQLALKFAEIMKHRLSCIWIRADQSNNFKLDYSKVLGRLLHDEDQLPKMESVVGGAIDDYLERTRDYLEQNPGDWLLILDNADDMDAFRESMERYLPMKGRILITTRDPRFQGDFSSPDDGMNVVPMDETQSLELLMKSIPTRLQTKDDDAGVQSQELVRLLGNLPLAIAQAAANIVDQQVSLSEYVVSFREASDRFEALKAPSHDRRTRDPRNSVQSVSVTWQISFERLDASSPLSVTLLEYMSCLHWDSIPRELLRKFPEFAGLSDIEFRNVLSRAMQLSLVEEYNVDDWPQLRMHPMTHEYAWKRTGENVSHVATECARVLAALFPQATGEDDSLWQLCSYLASHAIRVVGLSQSMDLESPSQSLLMQSLALYLNAFGNVQAACELAASALDMAARLWPDEVGYLNTFRRTKIQCLSNGHRFEESLAEINAWVESVSTAPAVGEKDTELSQTTTALSQQQRAALTQKYFVLKELRRHDEAHLVGKALEPPTDVSGNGWTALALISKHNSAHALQRAGRSREARPIVEEVFRHVRGEDGELRVDRREYLAFKNLKADILLHNGDGPDDLTEGQRLFREVYDEQFRTTGVIDSDTWIAANNVVGIVADNMGVDTLKSSQLRAEVFRQMLTACAAPGMTQMRTQASGKFQRHVAVFLAHFEVFLGTDHFLTPAERAQLLHLRERLMTGFLLQIDVPLFGEDFATKNTQGVYLQRQGRTVQAEALHREAVQDLEAWAARGPERPRVVGLESEKDVYETLSTYHYNLMLAIARQGRVQEASAYRAKQKAMLGYAEERWGSFDERMAKDEMDKLIYDEAKRRVLDGEEPSKDPNGWWAEHDEALSRAKMRYGWLQVPKEQEKQEAAADVAGQGNMSNGSEAIQASDEQKQAVDVQPDTNGVGGAAVSSPPGRSGSRWGKRLKLPWRDKTKPF